MAHEPSGDFSPPLGSWEDDVYYTVRYIECPASDSQCRGENLISASET